MALFLDEFCQPPIETFEKLAIFLLSWFLWIFSEKSREDFR